MTTPSGKREHEAWMNRTWRPAMAWAYMIICLNDFLFATLINYAFFYYTGLEYIPWEPLTLAGGGLFHMAMGAIVGVTAWQRTQEKMIEYKMTSMNTLRDNTPYDPRDTGPY